MREAEVTVVAGSGAWPVAATAAAKQGSLDSSFFHLFDNCAWEAREIESFLKKRHTCQVVLHVFGPVLYRTP